MVRSPSRGRRLVALFALLTPVVLTACEPSPPAVPDTGQKTTERVIAGSLHGRSGAYLTVGDAASRVDVRLATLPGLLYRISTPADSGLAPRISGGGGRLRVRLRATGDDGPDTVLILLNRAVRWDIRLPAGAGEQRLDLSAGSVARLDLGSAGLVTVDLPRPLGTVPVTLRGSAGSVSLSAGAPVRLRLRGGAGSVRTPWVRTDGVPARAVLADPRWRRAGDRYAFSAVQSVGTLTVR